MTIGIRAERRKKRAQRRLPALVGKKELSHVAGHDGEIRVRRAQPAGIAFDPAHPIAVRPLPGDVEHGRRRIDPGHPVTQPGQLSGDEPGSAAQVDDLDRAQLRRELQVEARLAVG